MKRYTAFTKNFFRQLARGEAVGYFDYEVEAKEDKIIVRGPGRAGRVVELHFRRKTGDAFGFSKDQLEGIFDNREKPVYTIRTSAAR